MSGADPAEAAKVAGSLRAVVAAVDAGAVTVDEVKRAYLLGAADALDGNYQRRPYVALDADPM